MQKVSLRARVFDYAGSIHRSRYRDVSFRLPLRVTRSAPGTKFSKLNVPARCYRCLRFDTSLTIRIARLAARVGPYSFSVGLFHPLLSASLPAHNPKFRTVNWTAHPVGSRSNLRFRNFGFPMRESCSFEISDLIPALVLAKLTLPKSSPYVTFDFRTQHCYKRISKYRPLLGF